MKEYKLVYRADVKPYLDELGQYIAEQTTPDFADRYLQKLRKEVEEKESQRRQKLGRRRMMTVMHSRRPMSIRKLESQRAGVEKWA